MNHQSLIHASLDESIRLKQTVLAMSAEIEAAGVVLIETLAAGGRIFFCGNGGSAADSQHLAAELVGRFETDNVLPAMALTTDSSIMTALGNDFGFELVYALQLKAQARAGDALVAITTSGNSANVLRAAETALAMGVRVVGMTGAGGGRLAELVAPCLVIPSPRTCRVQEVHITVGHIWCEMIERSRAQGGVRPGQN